MNSRGWNPRREVPQTDDPDGVEPHGNGCQYCLFNPFRVVYHGQPRWFPREADAVPLFRHDVVGEFSVAYLEPVKRYVMPYNSAEPRGITMREAEAPWGPWSKGTILFEPGRDKGYGYFMRISAKFNGQRDALSDPNREDEWGGEYGPYVIARFTSQAGGRCRISYTMSTWNPYQVVLMRSDLKLEAKGKQPPRRRQDRQGSHTCTFCAHTLYSWSIRRYERDCSSMDYCIHK